MLLRKIEKTLRVHHAAKHLDLLICGQKTLNSRPSASAPSSPTALHFSSAALSYYHNFLPSRLAGAWAARLSWVTSLLSQRFNLSGLPARRSPKHTGGPVPAEEWQPLPSLRETARGCLYMDGHFTARQGREEGASRQLLRAYGQNSLKVAK
ncbi:uncharacterized [Tachysurus ichikawai]